MPTNPLVLAHFSDFHLGHDDTAMFVQRARLDGLVRHALARGAEHLLFGGDLVDRGNLEDAESLVETLVACGMYRHDAFSVVPGNHDIWPIGERRLFVDSARYAASLVPTMFRREANPAQQRYETFARMFIAYEETDNYSLNSAYPALKRLGDIALVLLDTTAAGGVDLWEGRFLPRHADWVLERLQGHVGPRLLLMHHWPWRLEFKHPITRATKSLTFDDDNAIQEFIADARFDAVFCGHVHQMGLVESDEDNYRKTIGNTRVYCNGRSGGLHQGSDPQLAYHLIRVTAAGVDVETVFVRAADVG